MKRPSFFLKQKVELQAFEVMHIPLQQLSQGNLGTIDSFKTQKNFKTQFSLSNASTKVCNSINTSSKGSAKRCSLTSNYFTEIKQQNYKTETCKFWRSGVQCPYADNCRFAHGEYQIREKKVIKDKYRTKCCKNFFGIGACTYGNRCQFLHQKYSIQRQKQFYRKIMSQIHKDTQLFFLNQKRLCVLKQIQISDDKQNKITPSSSQSDIASSKSLKQKKKNNEKSQHSLYNYTSIVDEKRRFSIRL